MGTQRKNPDSLKSMLADIRNYGTGEYKYIKKLLFSLTGEDDWSDSQCTNCFEAILRYYIDDEKKLELMLAVSGILDGYRIIDKVTKRREKYLEYLTKTYKDVRTDPDSFRKTEEENCLEYIAKQLEIAIDNKTIYSLVKLWTSGSGSTQKAYTNIQDIIQSKVTQDDGKNIYIIINGGIRDSNINLGDNNEVNQGKKDNQDAAPVRKLKDKKLQKTCKSFGWGPERPTYTMNAPADHPTFNSITDNTVLGDERDFVRIVDKETGGTYSSDIELEANKDYEVYIYYHNNASATYNDKAHDRVGIAWNARVATNFPEALSAGERGEVTATISASNTVPEKVWDEAYITAKEDMTLHYVTASAKIYNGWGSNGSALPMSIFSQDGTFLGMDELNGMIYGGATYSGHILYTIHTAVKNMLEPDKI